MNYKKLFKIASILSFSLYLQSCNPLLALDIGECTFYVGKQEELCLSYDILRMCTGRLQVYMVEFN